MMIASQSNIEGLKDKPYSKLIKERNSLLRYIKKYEKYLKTGKADKELIFCTEPQPETIYIMYLEYLSMLCPLIRTKYNEEQTAKKIVDDLVGDIPDNPVEKMIK